MKSFDEFHAEGLLVHPLLSASRTHVGVTRYGYRAVMAGLRAGRVRLDHGHLLDGLEVRLKRDRDHGRGALRAGDCASARASGSPSVSR